MANSQHLEILKRGVDDWNQWREENPEVSPDLSRSFLQNWNLREADLHGADFEAAVLSRADFSWADLSSTDLSGWAASPAVLPDAILNHANLSKADLTIVSAVGANLSGAVLRRTNLSGANLTKADLREADFAGAVMARAIILGQLLWAETKLADADLSGSNLTACIIVGADLTNANLSNATIGWTTFADVDLSTALGLDSVKHIGPSTIGIDTLYKSRGNIAERFLRNCGVPDTMIAFAASLINEPSKYFSCFISYSNHDEVFAKQLHSDLQDHGVRCWFAPESLRTGDKVRSSIDEAIKESDKLLLVLSRSSVKSSWVEKEVETAFDKERHNKDRTMLFPIRLDNTVMNTDQAWAADIRRTRHIGDFTKWKDKVEYQIAFERLLRDLRTDERRSTNE